MQQAVSCHVEADPGDELWTTLLAHAAATNDLKLSCSLLQLSNAYAAAARTQLAGQLQVQLKTSSLQTRAAWLQRNSCLLRTLQVSLSGAVPEKAEACRMLAAAMTTLPMAGLRGFAVRNIRYESADTLLCGLSSVAGQLTQLELRMKSYEKPSSKAVEVLAGMAQLRELVLHEPNSAPFPCSFNGLLKEADLGRIESWFGCIGQALTQLTGLTCLQTPFGIRDKMGLLQQLPAGLRELRLGMDRTQSASLGQDVHHDVDADEGAIEAYFPGDAQVRKARRQQPLDLSHLTALTNLQLSAAVPLLSDDQLLASLLQLHARQCFNLLPLLHLSSLKVLALRPNTVPGSQLLALTQLTALQEVTLSYEGGYYPQGDWLEWDEELLQQHAAVWPKLPLRSLGFYEDSGLYHRRDEYSWQESLLPKECVVAAAQLTGLTHLALEGTVGRKGLLQVVQQLTGLRHLSLWWDWMTEYFDNDGYERGDYTQGERQQAAGDVLTLMRAIDEGLPRLQHLYWLCDTIRTKSADERMSLDRVALQQVLKELEDEAPDCVDMQQLYYAGKIWLNKE